MISENQNIKILVVSHKKYEFPKDDIYKPITVGNYRDSKYLKDDTGDNISAKNNLYCELTALYWGWKNLQCDIFGLEHYRRYLSLDKKEPLSSTEILSLLKNHDIILPKERYYIEGVAQHYINCIKSRKHDNAIQIELLRDTIRELQPDYLNDFDEHMKSKRSHMFNMFISSTKIANDYCSWLYPILFELENKINENDVMYDRIMGSFSEFLLDVWLKHNDVKWSNVNLLEKENSLYKKIKFVMSRRFSE